MAAIEKFEDIISWKKAIELNDLLYEYTERGAFYRDFSLKDQMKRSALSVSSNIAEGFERGSNNQFIYFLYIAKGSAGEFRSQLYVARRRKYINDEEFERLYNHTLEISKLISGLIQYLVKNRFKKVMNKLKSVVSFGFL